MLKNYFKIDENITLNNFLKELKDKKNSHYIILETTPESFVDIRTLALKLGNLDEKLKNLKKRLSTAKKDYLNFLINSGDRVIKTQEDTYYDFVSALKEILESNSDTLNKTLQEINKHEVFALNETDKITNARNLFLQKRINLLPVIEKLEIIGEVRPIDLLVGALCDTDNAKMDYYSKKRENTTNLPIVNIMNKRPLLFNKNDTLKNLIQTMIDKKLPSLIITNDDDSLHSTVSYSDIFKLIKSELTVQDEYLVEYSGGKELYDEEFDLIKDFADKLMKKIVKMSNYDNLKLSFKLIGEKDTGHQHKFIIKALLSHGNKTLHVEKEISTGTSDELFNDKIKSKWNIPQTAQETLKALEKKVIDEKRKMTIRV